MMVAPDAEIACGLVLTLACVVGCGGEPQTTPDGSPEIGGGRVVAADVVLGQIRDLDLLFVVDDSGDMDGHQQALVAGFPGLLAALTGEGEMPNLHIGVVSTDLGSGGLDAGGCPGNGDGGVLHSPSGCPGPDGAFIRDVFHEGERLVNYAGTLEEAFACIAAVGSTGCGFEQPLESMRIALSGTIADNAGFLREHADLAVVFVTNEDDCSAAESRFFDLADLDVGDDSSFRCFEQGVICEPDEPRDVGYKTPCRPRDQDSLLHTMSRYEDFLRELKDQPARILVTSVAGPAVVNVGRSETGNRPVLEPSCTGSAGAAGPAVRLDAFARALPLTGASANLCSPSLSAELDSLAGRFRATTACLAVEGVQGNPEDWQELDPCAVIQVSTEGEAFVPVCSNRAAPLRSDELPCYLIAADPINCSGVGAGLAVGAYGESSAESRLVVTCSSGEAGSSM